MGLDAKVYCDCFEKRRLGEPPPPGCCLTVAEDGSLLCGNDELDVQLAFDQWQLFRACEHENGVLVHHRIGNISLVADLRAELQRTPNEFPLILSRVLYNGTHCGDYVSVEDLLKAQSEISALREFRCGDSNMEVCVRTFESQMKELVAAALRTNKPIAF